MIFPQRLQLLRASALVALVFSAALWVDQWFPNPALCGFGSSCDPVLRSDFGKPLGIPLPLIGSFAFAGLLGLSLAPRASIRRRLRPAALAGGLIGATLIGVQFFVLGHVCPYCLLIDALAVVAGCLALPARPLDRSEEMNARTVALWLLTAFFLTSSVVVGSVAGRAGEEAKVPVPPQIVELWVPNKVNVVEIYDFECPHCRRLEPHLRLFLEEQGERVHHVRLTVPMPAHRQARIASRAFLCARRQGKGAEMAGRLIRAPALDPRACETIATEVGLSLPAYRACVIDPDLDKRLDADLAWVKEAHPAGLPVVWVQDQPLAGLRPPTALGALRAAFQQAERRLGKTPVE